MVIAGHPVDEFARFVSSSAARGADGVNFRAIAGREHDDFVDTERSTGVVHRLTDLLRGEGHPLAHIHVCAIVVDAQCNQIHNESGPVSLSQDKARRF